MPKVVLPITDRIKGHIDEQTGRAPAVLDVHFGSVTHRRPEGRRSSANVGAHVAVRCVSKKPTVHERFEQRPAGLRLEMP